LNTAKNEVIPDLTAEILKKERSMMTTTVTFIDDDLWFTGGESPRGRIIPTQHDPASR